MLRRFCAAVVLAACAAAVAPAARADMSIRFEKEVVENIREGNMQGLTAYLLGGGNPGSTDNENQPLLVVATRAGQPGMVDLLLQHRGRPDAADALGNTALYWAAETGQGQILDALIAAGAKLDPQNRQGLTPLMAAVRAGRVDMVRKLLAAGADPRLSDYTGRDAFGWAAGGPRGAQITAELEKAR